jgi:hypothetical protein
MASFAETSKQYKGIVKKDGKVIYTEIHTDFFNKDGQLFRSTTDYIDNSGKKFAAIFNRFKNNNWAVPDYKLELVGKNKKFGVYAQGETYFMYRDGYADKREEKEFDGSKDFYVAGQGIHYYLIENFEQLAKRKTIPFTFLIAADLKTFDFRYKLISIKGDIYKIRIEIDSWFLRLFVPHFDMVYDSKKKHILSYEGLSNFRDENDDLQSVTINYEY